jgi:Na+/H+ antiporter NhaD/arsenite permease-like protein
MDPLALVLYGLCYLGLALGGIPGTRVGRTGVMLLGAAAFLATGLVSPLEALRSVHGPTMAVLLGMMLVSAQYEVSGLYAAIGLRLARASSPRRLLLGIVVVAAGLSAVLTNDVVCVALTALLGRSLLRGGRDPLPFLLALSCATNIGSAATPIGNPQNVLIAQTWEIPFERFLVVCALPVVVSLGLLYAFLAPRVARLPATPPPPAPPEDGPIPPLDRRLAWVAVLLTAAAIALFLSPVPAYATALGVGGAALLASPRRAPRAVALVDWRLLLLFVGLFVVGEGFELSGWPARAAEGLRASGIDFASPALLIPATALLSNVVSNVPAVMIVLPLLTPDPETGAAVALASTFAGNALLVGSIANLIVAEQAARVGIRFGFREHLRVGLPVTVASLLVAGASLFLFW